MCTGLTMKNKMAWVAGFLLVAIISAALGVAASLMYLAKPFQKWQAEFSETYLPMQAEALQALRAGRSEAAIQYLEMATTHSLQEMGQQRDEGARVPSSQRSSEAVKYLCSQPPTKASSSTAGKLTFAESCVLLLQPLQVQK